MSLERWAGRLCRLLSGLLPRGLKQEFRDEIESVTLDLIKEARHRQGLWGLVTVLPRIALDILRVSAEENARRLRSSRGHSLTGTASYEPRGKRGQSMSSWIYDFRQAGRSLWRQPGFSAVVVVTLSVTMAAATTLFALLDTVVLRPLPFEQPDRLVAVWSAIPEAGREKIRVNGTHFEQWREESESLDRWAIYVPASMTLRGLGEPVQLAGTRVSEGFFPSLGVEPFLGRAFVQEDFAADAEPVVLLSESLWRSRFGGDRSILGRSLTLDDQRLTVIGVLPRQILPAVAWASGQLEFDGGARFYQPMTRPPRPRSGVYGVLGRLSEGVSLHQAQTELDLLAERLEQASPATNEGYRTRLIPLVEEAVGDVSTSLFMLLGAVGLLLAIACANVTCLLLVRIAGRHQELAVRGALGAGRWRLWRQIMAEGLLLVAAGAFCGTLLASWAVRVVPRLSPQQIPRLEELGLDPWMLAVTWAIFAVCGLLVAWLPAAQAARRPVWRPGGRSSESASGARWRQVLVTLQVALAVMLVIGSGLLLRSLHRLSAVDPGFTANHVVMIDLLHHPSRYRERHQLTGFYDALFARLEGLGGVQSVSASYDHPLTANWSQGFAIEGGAQDAALFRTITPGYFETLGIELLEGRGFQELDRADAPGVAVVNRAFAQRYLPEGAVRRRFDASTTQWAWGDDIPSSFEIVGVVEDVRFAGLAASSEPAYYLPYRQTPQHKMTVFVRATPRPGLVPEIHAHLRQLAPDLPILATTTLGGVLSESLAKPRFSSFALTAFAASSLLLAMIGLWGTLSYSIRQRRQEIGIRMALGAGRRSVFSRLLWHGLQPAIVGLALGSLGAYALRHLLQSMLYGVASFDPVTFLAAPLGLLTAAALACTFPAAKAAIAHPVEILRESQ